MPMYLPAEADRLSAFLLDPSARCVTASPGGAAELGVAVAECLGDGLHRLLHERTGPCPICEPASTTTPGARWRTIPLGDGWRLLAPVPDDDLERLRVALAVSRIGTFRWDLATGGLDWDANLKNLFGLDPETPVHGIADFVARIHPEDRARMEASIDETARSGIEVDTEYRTVLPDGSVRWILDMGRVVRDGAGRPLYMTGACADITDRRLAEDRLREADRRKDEFLAMLAHELRNPLAPIRNSVHLVARLSGEDSLLREPVRILERQVAHLSQLVDELLDVSRISRGRVTLRRAPLDLAALARSVVDDHRGEGAAAGVALELRTTAPDPWVDADATRLAQALSNLVQNAIKFSDPGAIVTVEVYGVGDSARISVRDTGIGMDQETLGRLFDTFVQADRSLDRARGGLGLGLALVKGLVELHGGSIVPSSAGPGKGSRFEIRLPAIPRPAAAAPAPAAPGPAARGVRVLIVEDHVDAAESLRLLLELEGHTVEVAEDGTRGLELARGGTFDVVLCDIGLPGARSGYDVARELRAEGSTARLIALTGYGQREDVERARAAGFDTHLTKPVAPPALIALLAAPTT